MNGKCHHKSVTHPHAGVTKPRENTGPAKSLMTKKKKKKKEEEKKGRKKDSRREERKDGRREVIHSDAGRQCSREEKVEAVY